MKLNTVIFDMDGLLIDSEPLWCEAADEVFQQYGFRLTAAQHITTTGMRTKEFYRMVVRSLQNFTGAYTRYRGSDHPIRNR